MKYINPLELVESAGKDTDNNIPNYHMQNFDALQFPWKMRYKCLPITCIEYQRIYELQR